MALAIDRTSPYVTAAIGQTIQVMPQFPEMKLQARKTVSVSIQYGPDHRETRALAARASGV